MDFLRNQIARIQQQVSGLSATQKMLVGALLVIMLMTLYGWSNFAGQAEMEVLLDQAMSNEDIVGIQKHLASNGIKYRVVGDRIHVAAERKYEALASLGYARALPRDTRSAFDEMIAKSSLFDSSRKQDALLNQAKQSALSQILRNFPRVRDAAVFIDLAQQRGFAASESSATVYMNTSSGESPSAQMVNAAADLVSGAVANLKRNRVKVIVNDVSYPVRGTEESDSVGAAGDERLALMQRNEQYLRERLHRHFSFIDGVQIDVSVKPNLERKETVSHTVDPKNTVQKPVVEDTVTEENSATPRGSGEPGIVPNALLSAEEASAGESSSETREKSRVESKVDYGQVDVKSWKPAGDVEVVGVSMLVPRSYFVQVYKKRMGLSDRDPDEGTLKPFVVLELAGLKTGVKTCLGLGSDELVHVDSYTDLVPMGVGMAGMPQAASTSMVTLATSHMKEIALGVLALVSLLMVTTMVKRGAPQATVAEALPTKSAVLTKGEESVGEASETSSILDGMELDEESVKARQMVSQVSNLVGENPEAAAMMVKRWLNRS